MVIPREKRATITRAIVIVAMADDVGITSWQLFRKAQAWHRRGAYYRAAAFYQQALAANPADQGAWLWRGLALAERIPGSP
jgi:tetratricopeptide (TPR) repeat protein